MAQPDRSTFRIERSIVVDAPAAACFERIADFHRWRDWSPWEEMDPGMERTFGGADRGVGATYGWRGNRKVGAGRMEITQAVEPSEVTVALEFIKPFKASNVASFALDQRDGSTAVRWTMTGRRTLLTKVMEVFKSMDAMMGPDFERGLARLKADAEGSDRR